MTMITYTTPEKAGVDPKYIRRFLAKMEEQRINLHDVIMMRGNEIFFEKYWPVVTENRPVFEGCELRMSIARGEALCLECNALYSVMACEGVCPKCGSRYKKILGGQQFLLKEIGYREEENNENQSEKG